MRMIALVLLLAACSPQAPDKPAAQVTYAGAGRDRLCLKGDRVGFITYGQGGMNCSAQGRIGRTGEHSLAIVPIGDGDCRIPAEEKGDTITLGKTTAACAYYCGPDATFVGRTFTKAASTSPAVDFAGDPLC